MWDSPDQDLSKNCQKRVKPLFLVLSEEATMEWGEQIPFRKLLERGSKFGGVRRRNSQDAPKSRRINAESRKKPSPTVKGIAPKEAAIQASGSTRAMSVKVIM